MSKLDELKDKPEHKRKLKKISVSEISYTAGLGAASGYNDALLFKNLDGELGDLSDEEKLLLKKLGTSTPTSKSPTSGSDEQGDVNINKTKGDDDMSEQLTAQVALLEKKLAASEAKGSLGKYSFEKEMVGGLAEVLAELSVEGQGEILEAFDFLIDCSDYAVAVAKEAKAPVEQENELQKQLANEAGEEDGQEAIQKSRAEVIAEKTEAEVGGK